MANRRLIAQAVLEDDSFIDLSNKARLLYVYINLHCDDEGFCGNPKSIGRLAANRDLFASIQQVTNRDQQIIRELETLIKLFMDGELNYPSLEMASNG